jgi:hypothetical protein
VASISLLSADSQPARIDEFCAFRDVFAVLPDISRIRCANDRKAEFRPNEPGRERREDFVYQESS